jgi:hypothetical protein
MGSDYRLISDNYFFRHDCQRSFDHTPAVDYTVPAVWVCDKILGGDHKRDILWEYIDLLHELKTIDARCFFVSAEFRSVLDGYYAEEFFEASLRAEENTRKLGCPSAADSVHAR